MKTMNTQVSTRSICLAVAVACVAALPVHAEETVTVQHNASKQETIGVVSGLAIGAAAGGPIGAIVGAAAGGWLGDRYHKQAVAKKELAAGLDKSEHDRTRLAQNVTELNGSLAHEQERGEQLDLALQHTDELQTDVTFRTNDDSIQTQAMSPLMKLGALAAALPDAKVRVSGYADPRGSEAVNEALSKKRAEAVAAVLTSAGVSPDRLIVEAHGKSEAVSAEGDMDGYAFERRVTVRIERTPTEAVARNE
ncbi:MAG: OmpA family protein [Sinobacteraceae bacterium]|nr:OmpA family protein [Nevskiaceae bacterium]